MAEQLRVDPILCDGFGMCAELVPERIRLDDWGYPIIDPRPIDAALRGHARRAVRACPVSALRLEVREPRGTAGGPPAGSPRPTRGDRGAA